MTQIELAVSALSVSTVFSTAQVEGFLRDSDDAGLTLDEASEMIVNFSQLGLGLPSFSSMIDTTLSEGGQIRCADP